MEPSDPLATSIRFSHEAMNTTFTVRIRGQEETVARGMAHECFARIDALENLLSRFREGSDVARINQLAAGETLYLSEECHHCLLIALETGAKTGGLFDVTLGTAIEHRKSGAQGNTPSPEGSLAVHPDVLAVTCIEPGRRIDLGGIGKGFALDELKRLLLDWGCDDALLTAGASSMLAIGPSRWPVDLPADVSPLRIALENEALSASGTHIQGSHIVHPDGGETPEPPWSRVWVVAETAAVAEVWSTAFMLMDEGSAAGLADGDPMLRAVYAEKSGAAERIL
ncbi:MAG: FAD:protein FMN transferase [Akkermansiaceae bacterium]|nr:FAD:protein FMN transferase [Akkermansiaceae bacterium]MCP5544229.1 FAD:protein FMN transferase [Akkermansiaceae bacterium]